jgi:hypothetical protein
MKLLLTAVISAATCFAAQSLTVHAVSHDVQTIDTGEHATCHNYGYGNISCNSRHTGINVVQNVVEDTGSRYTIQCTTRFIWQKCYTVQDGNDYEAKIKGSTMTIQGHKYKIIDERPK